MSDAAATNPDNLHLDDLYKRVQRALRDWHRETQSPSPLAHLHLFRQLHPAQIANAHVATNQVLQQALQRLAERFPQEAELLQRTVVERQLNSQVAIATNMAESTLFRTKKSAVEHLTAALWEVEQQSRQASSRQLLQRLGPPPARPLLGVEAHLQRLTPLLMQAGPPWIVALAGMGGMGKTSLADALVRHLAAQGALQELGWVTARQSVLGWDGAIRPLPEATFTLETLAEELCAQLLGSAPPLSPTAGSNAVARLRARLKTQPHLIVIDNLETVTDLEPLVMALREFCAPTKFLLTTRESLYSQPDIYHYPLPELAQADALTLLRQEAQQRNLVPLHQASDAELLPILDVVGGNPLALRLVIGQTYVHPLAVVLNDLTHARGLQNENLYTYLYRQAWELLDENARRAWLVMPLVAATGADLARLAQISALEPSVLVSALATLVRLNLVDVRGDLQQRRYTVHNLTRAFLHESVLRWS